MWFDEPPAAESRTLQAPAHDAEPSRFVRAAVAAGVRCRASPGPTPITASLPTGRGRRATATVAVAGRRLVTRSSDPGPAAAFVRYLVSPAGETILSQNGLTVLPLTLYGDPATVPASLASVKHARSRRLICLTRGGD